MSAKTSVLDPEHLRFMQLALAQARAALAVDQSPFGAVVVTADGEPVGHGHNTTRRDLDPTAHGEIVAIRAALQRLGGWTALTGATLYSTCEPCLLCCFVMAQLRFGRVVVAARVTDVPGYQPLLGLRLADVITWINGQRDLQAMELVADFMREEALELMGGFPWSEAAVVDSGSARGDG
jgi:tRNA(adenine34) deaminase